MKSRSVFQRAAHFIHTRVCGERERAHRSQQRQQQGTGVRAGVARALEHGAFRLRVCTDLAAPLIAAETVGITDTAELSVLVLKLGAKLVGIKVFRLCFRTPLARARAASCAAEICPCRVLAEVWDRRPWPAHGRLRRLPLPHDPAVAAPPRVLRLLAPSAIAFCAIMVVARP